jgi:hypothetical protein
MDRLMNGGRTINEYLEIWMPAGMPAIDLRHAKAVFHERILAVGRVGYRITRIDLQRAWERVSFFFGGEEGRRREGRKGINGTTALFQAQRKPWASSRPSGAGPGEPLLRQQFKLVAREENDS